MCLAIPGKIVSVSGEDPIGRTGKVSFGGVIKDISLSFVPDAEPDDYVIVHVGFALQKVDEEEAERMFGYLREMGELADLEDAEKAEADAAAGQPAPGT